MNRTALGLSACLLLLTAGWTPSHAYIPSQMLQRLQPALGGAALPFLSAQSDEAAESSEAQSGSSHHRRNGEVVEIGSSYHLAKDSRARSVVVLFAPASIDGKVDGDVVVVGGHATVNGEVSGSLICPFGSATLGPEARVDGDVITFGGDLMEAATTHIGGERHEIAFAKFLPHFEWLVSWFRQGLLHMRPLPPGLGWTWVVAGVFLLSYLAIALVLPKPVQACAEAFETKPVISFFSGLLMLVAFGPLLVISSVTVIGPLVVLAGYVAAAVLGRIALLRFLGQQFGRGLNQSVLQAPVASLVLGSVLVSILYMVPVLGFLVWAALVPIGIGAASVAAVLNLQSGAATRRQAAAAAAASIAPAVQGAAPAPADPEVILHSIASQPMQPQPTANPPTLASAPSSIAPPAFAPAPSQSRHSLGLSPAEWCALPRAGFWLRLLCTILDFIPFILIIPAAGPAWLLLWTAYLVAMWAWRGSTLGGIVLGLKVVRIDGRDVDLPVALVRGLASYFSLLVLFLGFFWAGWSREKQSWHDKIAGTVIVKVPKSMSLI